MKNKQVVRIWCMLVPINSVSSPSVPSVFLSLPFALGVMAETSIKSPLSFDRDFDREIECEIEWRSRLSLLDVHNLLNVFFRNVDNVFIEEYRLTRHCNMQRRLGTRLHYKRFAFDNIDDLLRLLGINVPLDCLRDAAKAQMSENKEENNAHHEAQIFNCNFSTDFTIDTFSHVKMTNCSHTFYFYDDTVDHRSNNHWPRVFQCKRSIEIDDTSDEDFNDCEAAAFEDGRYSGSSSLPFRLTAKQTEAFERLELTGLDKSDNNLGLQYIRKMYRYFERENFTKIRLAVYFIFDEYQQISYEFSIEYEFVNSHDIVTRRINCGDIFTERRVDFLRPEFPLESLLRTLSYFVHHVTRLCMNFVEKPAIKLGMDWTENVTSSSSVSLRSYTIDPTYSNSEENFARHVINVLTKTCVSGDVRLKRKVDGVKCHATFDGGNFLCVDDGTRIDLRKVFAKKVNEHFQRTKQPYDFCNFFSVDMIYQLERIDSSRYIITELSTVRNNYMKILSSLVQSFAPSRNCYKFSQEQRWPYGLFGVPLSDRLLLKMFYFKTLTCSVHSSSERITDQRYYRSFLRQTLGAQHPNKPDCQVSTGDAETIDVGETPDTIRSRDNSSNLRVEQSSNCNDFNDDLDSDEILDYEPDNDNGDVVDTAVFDNLDTKDISDKSTICDGTVDRIELTTNNLSERNNGVVDSSATAHNLDEPKSSYDESPDDNLDDILYCDIDDDNFSDADFSGDFADDTINDDDDCDVDDDDAMSTVTVDTTGSSSFSSKTVTPSSVSSSRLHATVGEVDGAAKGAKIVNNYPSVSRLNPSSSTRETISSSIPSSKIMTATNAPTSAAPVSSDCRFYVTVSSRQSTAYLERLSKLFDESQFSDAILSVNRSTNLASILSDRSRVLSFGRELRAYFRRYVLSNILFILHSCGLDDACKNNAFAFFTSDIACSILSDLSTGRFTDDEFSCIKSNATFSSSAPPIDGFLFYDDSAAVALCKGRKPTKLNRFQLWNFAHVNRSRCAFFLPALPYFANTTVLKLKPFQTIELMCSQVPSASSSSSSSSSPLSSSSPTSLSLSSSLSMFSLSVNDSQKDNCIPLVDINFHSSRISDTPFLYCPAVPRDTFLSRHTPPAAASLSKYLSHRIWKRFDGVDVRVYVHPRFDRQLISYRVYEFLCYSETEYFLIKERSDKILPDDDRKISNIVWRRTDFSEFFFNRI